MAKEYEKREQFVNAINEMLHEYGGEEFEEVTLGYARSKSTGYEALCIKGKRSGIIASRGITDFTLFEVLKEIIFLVEWVA